MKDLVNLCVDIFSNLFTIVCIKKFDLTDAAYREYTLKLLASAHAAITGMVIRLGYTPQDLHEMMQKGLEGKSE